MKEEAKHEVIVEKRRKIIIGGACGKGRGGDGRGGGGGEGYGRFPTKIMTILAEIKRFMCGFLFLPHFLQVHVILLSSFLSLGFIFLPFMLYQIFPVPFLLLIKGVHIFPYFLDL